MTALRLASLRSARLALLAGSMLVLAGCAADRCCRPCPDPCAAGAWAGEATGGAPGAPPHSRFHAGGRGTIRDFEPRTTGPTSATAPCPRFECFRFVNHAKNAVEVVYWLCDDRESTSCSHYGRFVVPGEGTCSHVPDPARSGRSLRLQVLDPTWVVSVALCCPLAMSTPGVPCPCLRRAHVHYYGPGLNAHAELIPHGASQCAKMPVQVDPAAKPAPAEMQMPCGADCGD